MVVEIKKISNQDFGYANILVFGESGSGKTHFASTYKPESTLFINIVAESGLMTLRAKGIDLDVVDITGYKQMMEIINWLKTSGGKYDLIFIDSLSQWQKLLEKEIPDSGNKYAKWNTIKDYTKEVIGEFKKLPFHKVFTCEIVKDKDEEAGTILYIPSLAGSSKHEIQYWFDEVYYFTRFQENLKSPIKYKALTAAAMKYPCKSRLGLPVEIDNPNLKDIIEKAGFKKIDKEVQTKELKSIAEEPNLPSDTNVEIMRKLLSTKDVDINKFLTHYGASSIPAFPGDKVADAIQKLQLCKDKVKAVA